ncbi:hypothetical protein HGP14_30790 [Rhizobium sp. P32RR-XVIII]|uniref:three component ABC system middle component n=1 Tax=Rhizobium sp. P32RR-XVIII TaxID=2726738 RepID=UPI00145728DF|nr:three component ABC system middle component [Rhizobium sp. P32RR-XVIII]NLS07649.1 hypothetical protein [Rhizobium sp. P32RR-XVIII]
MSTPSSIALVQNPAFGALLLWTFGKAYQQEAVARTAQLPAFFLVLPLVYHAATLKHITSTYSSSGLAQVARKLGEERELLIAIHGRAVKMRDLTLASIATGVSSTLLHVEYKTGHVRSNEARPPKNPERLKYHVSGADKLGRWFARLPPEQPFSLLWVEP